MKILIGYYQQFFNLYWPSMYTIRDYLKLKNNIEPTFFDLRKYRQKPTKLDVDLIFIYFVQLNCLPQIPDFKLLKQYNPNIPIIGGHDLWPYKMSIEKEFPRYWDYLDAISAQNCDDVLLSRLISSGKSIQDFIKDSHYFYTKDDQNPIIINDYDYDETDFPLQVDPKVPMYNVSLMRSCPNNCSYCYWKSFHNDYKIHSKEWVIRNIFDRDLKWLMIDDLSLYSIPEFYTWFFEECKKRKIKLHMMFSPYFRGEKISDLDYLWKTFYTDFSAINIFVDCPSKRICENVCHKQDSITHLPEFVEKIKKTWPDKALVCQFLMRFPTETVDDIKEMKSIVDRLPKNVTLSYQHAVAFNGNKIIEEYPDNITMEHFPARWDSPEFHKPEYSYYNRLIPELSTDYCK